MKRISNDRLDRLVESATASPRKRMNYNLHQSPEARVQRFFNALEDDTYIRPHRHVEPDKFECFFCVRGRGAAIVFDESGTITDTVILSPDGECLGVEIPPHTWHTIISLAPGSIFFEVKEGPYTPLTDKEFAPWSPEPDGAEQGDYLTTLKKAVAVDDG
ncbi:MAG: WbuC family cupin fold metalloprotein [Thermodesulfobacteriota bacterium]